MRVLIAFALFAWLASPARAQHNHRAAEAEETATFVVNGLRVDEVNPPPGSGVGRAGARLAGGGYLHVVYGKPYVRGRTVFGGVVGFDQVWTPGAHNATELLTTVPVTAGGVRLEPGAYSVFVTPGRSAWTVHINSALGMHLADEYDPELDLARVQVPTENLEVPIEGLTIDFVAAERGADLRIRWDRTGVTLPIRVD